MVRAWRMMNSHGLSDDPLRKDETRDAKRSVDQEGLGCPEHCNHARTVLIEDDQSERGATGIFNVCRIFCTGYVGLSIPRSHGDEGANGIARRPGENPNSIIATTRTQFR